MNVGVILPVGERQKCFWSSYYKCKPGYKHDIILIHRNSLGIDHEPANDTGRIYKENKIINNKDVPHREFGAYRYFFNKYKDNYDVFVFISDDVVLKRDFWLKDIIDTLSLHSKIGFGGSQIFNGGNNKYPHESHIRAPLWFAKTTVLKKIQWEFDSSHDGEMKIGLQCAKAGYIGVQCGNKINLGYDATEPSHITQLLEQKYFSDIHPFEKHTKLTFFETEIERYINDFIYSPYPWIGKRNVIKDIEPFNNLIFEPTIELAKKYNIAHEIIENTFIIK